MLEIGEKVPDFAVAATGGRFVTTKALENKYTLLYFYPRDNTPGCTQEGRDFSKAYSQFCQLEVGVFGVSRDSLQLHEKFKASQQFPFDLIADPDEILCQLFDVMRTKNMYGKQVRGIERSTFILDKSGVLLKAWRKVQVPGHVDQVLEAVKNI